MVALFFAVSTVICATMWLASTLGADALVLYMKEKGYTLPTKEEVRAYVKKATRKRFPKISKRLN